MNDEVARPARPGKGLWIITWLAFVAGIAASLAANVAHTNPTTGARFVAGWAPLALLLTIEVMMRVPAPRSRVLTVLRYGSTVAVAGVAAVASFRHMRGLATTYGEDTLTANTLPLSVDGLIVVASIALITLADQRHAATAGNLYEKATEQRRGPPTASAVSDRLPAARTPSPAPHQHAAVLPVPAAATAGGVGAATAERSLPDGSALPLPNEDPLPLPPPGGPLPLPSQSALPLPDEDPLPLPPGGVLPLPLPGQSASPLPDELGLGLDFTPALVRLDGPTRRLYLAAYRHVLEATAAGTAVSGRDVGARCGRSERWGRDRIAEVRAARSRTSEREQPPPRPTAGVPEEKEEA